MTQRSTIEIRNGVPMIAGTQMKVIEVALDRLAHHWDADEIHRQHPHLSLGQIYAALAYYYDHQAQMDAEIQRQLDEVDELRAKAGPSPVRAKPPTTGKPVSTIHGRDHG